MSHAISQGNFEHSAYGHIIKDIHSQVAALQSSNFIFNTRNWNNVVDALAKKAKNYRELQVWLENLRADIVPLVFFDIHWCLFHLNKNPGYW